MQIVINIPDKVNNRLRSALGHGYTLRDEDVKIIAEAIYNGQTKQPEIIRCMDCEHWDTSWQTDNVSNYHYCPFVDGKRRDDFYCADAVRKKK